MQNLLFKTTKTPTLVVFLVAILLFQGCERETTTTTINIYNSSNDVEEEVTNTEDPTAPEPTHACSNGFAGEYPCSGYDLMGFLSIAELVPEGSPTNIEVNDIWGWTDPISGTEYALIGTSIGTSFIDVSDPTDPVFVGFLATATYNSTWRDIKVYKNFAFIVSEAFSHGMQVFDLRKLRFFENTPETFISDVRYTGFGNAHNIVINETTGYAYAVGTSTYNGGAHFINIQNPLNPIGEGGYNGSGYSHDAQVVTYNGPDSSYSGKEIYIGSNENSIVFVDISNKAAPTFISSAEYVDSDVGYTHQGWFTEDMRYFIVGDEFDELYRGYNTRSIVLDVTDLENPVVHMEYLGSGNAIDHNGYIKQNTYYLANYTAGVRMIDLTNIDSGTMTELGYFDTHPENNFTNFNGAWSVYPYFSSDNIIVSDINRGLFIIRKSNG